MTLFSHQNWHRSSIILMRQDGAAFGTSSTQPFCEVNAEKTVLSALYSDKNCLPIIRSAGVCGESFSQHEHNLIFNELIQLIGRGESSTYERVVSWAEQNKIDRQVLHEGKGEP